MNTFHPETALALAPGVRLHAVDDENGFVESRHQVQRIRGSNLLTLTQRLLPALDGTRTVREVAAELQPWVRNDELTGWLEELRLAGLILERAEPASSAEPAVIRVAGPTEFTAPLGSALTGDGVNVQALDCDLFSSQEQASDLVVLAAPSVFDHRTAQLARACVAAGQAHLVFGFHPDAAFVGPVWDPVVSGACFDCLRLRLHSNAPHGRVRVEYQRFLEQSDTPAANGPGAPPTPLTTMLAGIAARQAVRWLDDRASDPNTRVTWIPHGTAHIEEHAVLVLPHCPGCGKHRDGGAGPVPSAGDLTAACDALTGIVHSATVRRADTGPRIFISGSTSSDLSLLRPSMRTTLNGGGGFTRQAAEFAALGESVERYAASIYDRRPLRLARYSDLDEPAIHPDQFALFSPEQYDDPSLPFRPFTEDTPLRWTPARRWHDGATVWVPASQAFLSYRRTPGEEQIAPSISTGLAAGPGYDDAVLAGLYEVLERDALSISWLHRLPPRAVPAEAVQAASRVQRHLAGRTSWNVRFHDVSLDVGLPVVAAVMEYSHGRESVLSFGSACRSDLVSAIEKAFLEAAQGLTYVRRLLRTFQDWDCQHDFADVDEFNKHAVLYTKWPELRARAGYLVDPLWDPVVLRDARTYPDGPPRDPREEIDRVCGELRGLGHDVCVVDLTTPDARQLGVRVVRVMVPGMHHLAGVHHWRYLGGERVRTVPGRLGWTTQPDNPFPHPLP